MRSYCLTVMIMIQKSIICCTCPSLTFTSKTFNSRDAKYKMNKTTSGPCSQDIEHCVRLSTGLEFSPCHLPLSESNRTVAHRSENADGNTKHVMRTHNTAARNAQRVTKCSNFCVCCSDASSPDEW